MAPRAPPPPRKHGKRKSGHIGFQSNEIAFIEDEMAALAAEYGLAVDHEVAQAVTQRKNHKKKARLLRRQEPSTTTTSTAAAAGAASSQQPPRIALLTPPRRRVILRGDFNGDHDLISKILRNVLPEGVSLGKCDVPGCSCSRGHRETVLNTPEGDDNSEQDAIATESDVVRHGACKKCRHGVLQHALVEDADSNSVASKPSGGQRLLGALFALIRTARLAGTVFRSRVWVSCLLEMLGLLLANLKKQFAAGGTQNGQKTLTELQQEQIVLAELSSLLKKAEFNSQKAVSRDELPIEMANALDPMYFRVYYACVVLYGRACAAVPPPEEYFSDLESFTPESYALTQAFVNQELLSKNIGEDEDEDEEEEEEGGRGAIPLSLFKSLALPLAKESSSAAARQKKNQKASGGNTISTGITLLDIYHLRLREGIRLFYEQSIGMSGEMDALLSNARGVLSGAVASSAVSEKSSKKGKSGFQRRKDDAAGSSGSSSTGGAATAKELMEMPAYELLAQWRNNCRDWCCHLYAYATPTPDALRVIQKYAPIVEMGAGTGYWSALLASRGVDVMAFDACPPSLQSSSSSSSSSSTASGEKSDGGAFAHLHKKKAKDAQELKQNAYHGQVPTFNSVATGAPETLKTNAETHTRSLLLCYPPPQDDMARASLSHFKGDHVIYVGEWQGDTADRGFEKLLVKKFTLVEEVELPNWGNSAYSLTVWKRKPTAAAKKKKSHVGEPSIVQRLSCFHCHASLLDATTPEDAEEFKRCVLCKTNVYCSEECSDAHAKAHAAEHALRLVFLENESKLDFANDLHYKPLQVMAASAEEDDESESDEETKVVVSKAKWSAVTNKTAVSDSEAEKEEKKTSGGAGGGFAFNFGA